jgi:UDP-2,4-diacetamido-2,4,6-trideoxy-beta-L-altropyranose hydrolase
MNNKANIAFRVDSSTSIGTGHVMRCMALAQQLQALGCHIYFYCANLPGNLSELIARNYPVETISEDAPLHFVDVCRRRNIGAVVIDHYNIDYLWESVVHRELKVPIVVIDDLANRQHQCQLLIDQNLGRKETDYDQLLSGDTQRLIGTQYALLRPEFSELRAAALLRRRNFSAIERVLISLGGADPDNVTLQVLQQLEHMSVSGLSTIDVVVGSSYPHNSQLTAFIARTALPVAVHTQVGNIGELMLLADISVGAGGSSAWERCVLGLPSIAIGIASNQLIVLQGLQEAGAAVIVRDPTKIRDEFSSHWQHISSPSVYAKLSAQAAAMVDGLGAKRVADQVGALL